MKDELLLEKISTSTVFMQYGANDCVIEALNRANIKAVIAVEADKSISDHLYQQAESVKERLHLIYCNVGELDASGKPIKKSEYERFHQFMVLPWALSDKYNQFPDLIHINGPFKMASFLYSLLCAEEGTKVLFEDFDGHAEYELAKSYATYVGTTQGVAEFVVNKNYIISELAAMIAKYSVIA